MEDSINRHFEESLQTLNKYGSLDTYSFRSFTSSIYEAVVLRPGGISVIIAALFVAGERAGVGLITLPYAVSQTGWIGLVLILVFGMMAGYNGMNLGKCWTMLLNRYPDLKSGRERRPYPTIGQEAYGKWMRNLIRVCIKTNLLFGNVIGMLIASGNIQSLIQSNTQLSISFCYWLIVITVVLIPLSWLGTPKDIWPAAVGSSLATLVAAFLIFTCIIQDKSAKQDRERNPATFLSLSLSIATILFVFGRISTFPTIQNDMKEPSLFPRSVFMAYCGITILYFMVSTSSYFVYGSDVHTNILTTIPPGNLKIVAAVLLLLCNVFFSSLIILNPIAQDLEETFGVPREFTWKRCVLRTMILLLILLLAETFPDFVFLLNILGGSTIAFASFMAPPLLYMRLKSTDVTSVRPEKLPLYIKVLNYEIIGIGALGLIVGTSASIYGIIAGNISFIPPCYVNMTAAGKLESEF